MNGPMQNAIATAISAESAETKKLAEQVEALELRIMSREVDCINASEFWISQYDRCAMEHLDILSADSSDESIGRVVRLCSKWAEASLEAAEFRWGREA